MDCEKTISNAEILEAVNTMKKGKSPGMDGIPKNFYHCFWNIIEGSLFEMINECIINEGMTMTMKQEIITLLPKPDKDPLLLDNWRPITLLNVDYKILSLLFARCLRKGLSEIINETQTGL